MKRKYITPDAFVVEIKSNSILAGSDTYRSTSTNANLGNPMPSGNNPGSEIVRSRQASFCDWDEE